MTGWLGARPCMTQWPSPARRVSVDTSCRMVCVPGPRGSLGEDMAFWSKTMTYTKSLGYEGIVSLILLVTRLWLTPGMRETSEMTWAKFLVTCRYPASCDVKICMSSMAKEASIASGTTYLSSDQKWDYSNLRTPPLHESGSGVRGNFALQIYQPH